MSNAKQMYNTSITNGLPAPSSINIEQAVLGAMLVDSDGLEEALLLIKSEQVFYTPQHQVIFKAIKALVMEDTGVDLLTVSNKLRTTGDLKTAGGDFYLIELTQKVASAAHIQHHARVILEQWVKREIIKVSSLQISDSYSETVDIFNLLAKAEQGLDAVTDMLQTGNGTPDFSAALDQVVKRVEFLTSQEEGNIAGIPTGFKNIDKFTGGWQPGDLVIVAARPGMGKTSLILKNLLELAKMGHPVGMFSLEMSIQQLVARLVAINSNFHLSQLIKKGFEHDRYFETLIKLQAEMHELPIYIDDTAGATIHQLLMKARLWKRKYKIKALFVDYIQLMSGENGNGNREQEIAQISRKLKQIAKELEIPVIALSQLSRSVETRGGDKRPRLADLRESGAIEQDADTVLFIYRPDYYGLEPSQELMEAGGNCELHFAKYRAGSLETKALWWEGDKTKFSDPEERFNLEEVNTTVTNNETPF